MISSFVRKCDLSMAVSACLEEQWYHCDLSDAVVCWKQVGIWLLYVLNAVTQNINLERSRDNVDGEGTFTRQEVSTCNLPGEGAHQSYYSRISVNHSGHVLFSLMTCKTLSTTHKTAFTPAIPLFTDFKLYLYNVTFDTIT
jgi:hypothetical protein